MRLLFTLDAKDYDRTGKAFVRPSVRGILLREGKAGMVHSLKYDYYKFPGGGIETGETKLKALAREVREETGLRIIPETARAYGFVHRIQKGKREAMFLQDSYYYFCETMPGALPQCLDGYEAEEGFTLEFVRPAQVLAANRRENLGPVDRIMCEREARVLELLMQEGYI